MAYTDRHCRVGAFAETGLKEIRMANELPSNAKNRYEVTRADLPLHCPMEGMSLWNSHPRVYLPIQPGGEERCPYCGAVYVWVERAGPAPG